jgi:hypothetical protein
MLKANLVGKNVRQMFQIGFFLFLYFRDAHYAYKSLRIVSVSWKPSLPDLRPESSKPRGLTPRKSSATQGKTLVSELRHGSV